MTKHDLTGRRFGRLTVIGAAPSRGKRTYWKCLCDCGNTREIHAYNLVRGATKSCGCLNNEKRIARSKTHGQTKTRLHRTWCHIKGRCLCKTDAAYKNYGGRGITICDEWRNSFEAFRDWAIAAGYTEQLTIDRIDPNGNYSPENCRWVDMKVQNRNKRNNLVFKGKCLAVWCEELGISSALVEARYRRLGWPLEKAIFTPVRFWMKKPC